MRKLFDKSAVILITVICTVNASYSVSCVAVLLTALTVSMLSQYAGNGRISLAMNTVYILLCLIEPVFCIGLPLACYEIFLQKQRWLYPPALLSVILCITKPGISAASFCAAVSFVSILLQQRTSALEDAQQKLIETRDASAELNMLLAERNRRLIESQDSEIYTAKLKERNRIAREIHDNVGHMITRCILQMGALIVLTKDEERKKDLQSVQDTLNSAMTSVRSSVHDLHDDSIDLKRTIEEAAASVSGRFRVTIEYDCGDDTPNNVKFAFIGIAKEAINNAAKYSSGDRISISVQEFPCFYRLIVRDNGSNPFNDEIQIGDSGGIGLSNMRDRADGLNGIIRISSSHEEFKVFVTVPKKK